VWPQRSRNRRSSSHIVQASLPVESHEGLAPVAVAGDREAAQLVGDDLRGTVIRVALPAVASSLLMTLFASVDAFWVGTRIGPTGLAAVSTSLFWIWMIISVAEKISVGLTAVVARRYGEGRPHDAIRVAGSAILVSVALGALVAVLGISNLSALFGIMQTPADVRALGATYLGTYLVGTPLLFGFFAVDATFRASGDTRTPFVLLLTSVAVTLVLDPVLILGLGPAPTLGIAGAAIATVSTRGGVFVMGVAIALRRGLVRLGAIQWPAVWSVCRVGLPTALTGVTFSLIYVALTRTTTRFGVPALAALGIGHRVESWLFMIGVGFGAATAAIVGQNLGARRADRAYRAGWLAVAVCTVPGVIACVTELAFAPQFAGLFTSDPAVVAEASRYLRIAALAQIAVSAEIVLEGAMGGAGDTIPPMITSTLFTAARIPLAAWAAERWNATGIWWVLTATALCRALGMMALWKNRQWERKSL
jgi:putative MATE family efflux protein